MFCGAAVRGEERKGRDRGRGRKEGKDLGLAQGKETRWVERREGIESELEERGEMDEELKERRMKREDGKDLGPAQGKKMCWVERSDGLKGKWKREKRWMES